MAVRIDGLSSKKTTVRVELNLPLAQGEQKEDPRINVPVPPRQ
jgi:3-phosphoglycerate kinase